MKKQKKETLFYCYNCPTSGYFTVNGYKYFYGEDFRTAERYQEYVDCGFNMVQARGENSYSGEEWEGSNCQRVFREALKGGCKKILVTDGRFDHWIRDERNLVGKGRLFATEAELDKAVAECVAPYCTQEGFYGIQLFDEPMYDQFPAYGQLVRSLKRVLPNAYVQCNLLPMTAPERLLIPHEQWQEDVAGDKVATEQLSRVEIYEKYVGDFQKLTEMDSLHFDEYPFRREYIISGNTLPNYQLVARMCQKRGLDFRVVLQSFAHIWNGNHQNRRMTESDMYWQTNLAMGFGVREYSFYTYFAKPDFQYKDSAMGEMDGAAFINLDGSRTKLYEYTKRIIAEMKKLLDVSWKYEYQSSHIVTEAGKTCQDFDWTKYLYEDEKCPLETVVDKGVALVTRQTNGDDELYMFENIGNVRDELFDGAPPMQFTVKLPAGEKKFYFRGEEITAAANENGEYVFSLKVGDAIFVEIIK
ncbi:MAG: hypothetical protein IJZ32_05435 [Clostridia bacterium]|nr:hypothetical protein [Clostridia bacterium]